MNSVDDCAGSAPPKEADSIGLIERLRYDVGERYNSLMQRVEKKTPLVYSVLTCFIPVYKKEYHH